MNHEVLLNGPMYAPIAAELERKKIVHNLWEAADRDALLDEIAPRITAVELRGC